jgi:HK97 family phage portal protein
LIPIPNPDLITPYIKGGELWYNNQNAGLPTEIPATEMLHYKGMVWDNPLKGMSSIAYHRERLGIIIAAEKTAAVTYKSGAKKFAISSSTDVNEGKQKLLKETLEMVMNDEAVSVVLPAGGKIEELSLSPVDADYINNANLGVQEINRMLGIPNSLNNLDGATKGSAEQEWQSFYSMTLLPDSKSNEQELRRKLFTEREKTIYSFKYSFNSLMRANATERFEIMGKAIRSGIMTPETAQDLEGLPRTEGSNQTYLDANLIPTNQYNEWIDSKITQNNSKQFPNPNGDNQL